MKMDDDIIRDINLMANWLSDDELPAACRVEADLIVLAGHAIVPAILGVMALASQSNIPLLFSGGVGHSTALLREALAENPLTRNLTVNPRSEADIFFSLATDVFGIPPSRLYVENRSTNCGQNADFTRQMIVATGLRAKKIILSQDPLMQRRTRETFAYNWRQNGLAADFINWPVFVPQLLSLSGQVTVIGAQGAGIWDRQRFIAMTLGEMRRLYDDANGYGPAGAGFIGHVTIPQPVLAAWTRIRQQQPFAELSRA